MPNKSNNFNVSDVKVSIGDIRKMFDQGYTLDAEDAICDKLEEFEERLSKIEEKCNF